MGNEKEDIIISMTFPVITGLSKISNSPFYDIERKLFKEFGHEEAFGIPLDDYEIIDVQAGLCMRGDEIDKEGANNYRYCDGYEITIKASYDS